MSELVVENKPTDKYLLMLKKQREWLYNIGTTSSRANSILTTLKKQL
jgi:hypothetical protein